MLLIKSRSFGYDPCYPLGQAMPPRKRIPTKEDVIRALQYAVAMLQSQLYKQFRKDFDIISDDD